MRKDFDYIQGACDVILTTTDKGHYRLLKFVEENKSSPITVAAGKLYGLLSAVEENYYVLPRTFGIEEMYKTYTEQYSKMQGIHLNVSSVVFKRALTDGLVGVKLVIWDVVPEIRPYFSEPETEIDTLEWGDEDLPLNLERIFEILKKAVENDHDFVRIVAEYKSGKSRPEQE